MPGESIFRPIAPQGPRILLLILALAAAGCAQGGVRDGVYHAPKGRYRIHLPPGTWDLIEIKGTDLALASPDRSLTILTGTLCNRYRRAKLESLSKSLFVGLVDRRVREEGPVSLPAGEAQRIVLEGRMNGTGVAAEAYTLRESPCLFDFIYLADPPRFESGVKAFRAMMETLRLSGKGRE